MTERASVAAIAMTTTQTYRRSAPARTRRGRARRGWAWARGKRSRSAATTTLAALALWFAFARGGRRTPTEAMSADVPTLSRRDDDARRDGVVETSDDVGVGVVEDEAPRKMRRDDVLRCDALTKEWVERQRQAHAARTGGGDEAEKRRALDFLYFLHVPRTAGRSFHWCFLKPAFEQNALCGNHYMGVKMNPKDPKCHFLATHDDYSLVERFREQPRVVTMLRKPSSRALSSYEFSIEVAARSFGVEPNAKRVNTREVWPWNVLTRHMDALLRDYDGMIRKDKSQKVSISNVYENKLYTPFEDWAEMQMVHDDIHNGQFLQVLGLTNNTDERVEPNAEELRKCALWRGTKASKTLMDYAKERLEKEIDVVVLHERLDESIELAAHDLNLPLDGQAHIVNPANIDRDLLQKRIKRLTSSERRGDVSEVVGFVFRFNRLTRKDLNDKAFRERYVSVLSEGVAMKCGVSQDKVEVWPLDIDGDWGRQYEGFHTLTVTYSEESKDDDAYDDMVVNADALFEVLQKGTVFEVVIQPNVKADETYGDFELSAFGRGSTDGKTVMKLSKPVNRTLGEQYRVCEATQLRKYGRLRQNTLKHIEERIDGSYETFSSEARKRIPRRVIDRVDELNFLDYELWAFANKLFDERMARLKNSPDGFPSLPERLATD